MTSVQVVTLTRATVRAEHARFREWLVTAERRYDVEMSFSDAQPITNNRNQIASRFLERGHDYMLMLDDDNAPTFNPLDFVGSDYDVLGFPYPTWRAGNDPPLQWIPDYPHEGGGIIETDWVGTGCILIARRVLERFASLGEAPFMDDYDERGWRVWGEDIHFCRRARDVGYTVWLHAGRPVWHFKAVELTQLSRWLVAQGAAVGKVEA